MPEPGPKKVFLIRHAQSLENQRIGSLLNCMGDLGRFSLPKRSDVGASFELLNISANHDAPISEHGLHQCETMKTILRDNNFVASNQIELVVHSTLQRARQTCHELIGCSSKDIVDPTKKQQEEAEAEEEETKPSTETYPEPIQRVVNLAALTEITQMEWIPGNTGTFKQRVASFEKWLAEQPESVVCVVGHSQYFKFMLGMPFKFDNCDVYQVMFDPKKIQPNAPIIMEHNGTADEVTLKPEWYDLKLLHPFPKESQAVAAATTDNGEENVL